MQVKLFQALVAQRPALRLNWERLLRIERVNSPLANPDTLVHLLDHTLDEFFLSLPLWSPHLHSIGAAGTQCPCGLNPLLAYFSAGIQAVREGLIYAQLSITALTPVDRDEALVCVNEVFAHISRREIESFCGVCQLRGIAPKTRWQPFSQSPLRHKLPYGASLDRSMAPPLQSAGIRG